MENKYILGTDTFDNKTFSLCLFDVENKSFILSENIVGEKDFENRVKELLVYYNCCGIEEGEIVELKYCKDIPQPLKVDKWKDSIKEYLLKEDCINHYLLTEWIKLKNEK